MLYRKYEVWITDGADKKLPEYAMEYNKKARTATCYIPSESGKTFVVHCKDWNGAMHHFSLVVKLDGRQAGASKCKPGSVLKRIGIRNSSMETYAAYQFANLETTEDETVPQVPIEELGTIEVAIELIRANSIAVPFAPHGLDEIGVVNERSKLAGTHCATLGPRIAVHYNVSKERYHTVPLDPNDRRPYVIFQFKYRPAAILRAQEIDAPVPQTKLEQRLRRVRLEIIASQNRRAMSPAGEVTTSRKRPASDSKAGIVVFTDGKENTDVKPERPHKRVKCEPED